MAEIIKMGRVPVHTLFATIDATVEDTVSTDEIKPQLIADETGAFQVALNQLTGAGALGAFVIEGKLHPDAPWAEIAKVPFADFQSAGVTVITTTSVPMVKHMRAATRDTGAGYTIAAGTTASLWIME